MAWGILIGTYSSIYVASAVLLYLPPLRPVDVQARSVGDSR
jgi:preprotein translocase subunit SecF